MARKKLKTEEKKGKLSVTISKENYETLVCDGINKSKLINWLLEEHLKNLK